MIFSKFFRKPRAPLETRLQRYFNDFFKEPQRTTDWIKNVSPETRLANEIFLICLYGVYSITTELSDAFLELGEMENKLDENGFNYDSVAIEVMAFIFYFVMPKAHLASDIPDNDVKLESVRLASVLVDSFAEKLVDGYRVKTLKYKILGLSMAAANKQNIFELVAFNIFDAMYENIKFDDQSIFDYPKLSIIQSALINIGGEVGKAVEKL